MKTRLYRVALVIASAVGSAVVLVQNAGDLTDPTVQATLLFAVINLVIVAIRQIGDPETPTLPSAGPVVLPPGAP